MSLRRGLLNALILSLVFWLLVGSCGYYGYRWAVRDKQQSGRTK
jgi:hypothetical protein